MKNLVIFGIGKISDVIYYYFDSDPEINISGFCVDAKYVPLDKQWKSLPCIDVKDITKLYPPDKYYVFVAIGYQKNNKMREEIFAKFKKLNYKFLSYISKPVLSNATISVGDNCFIMDGVNIQPHVNIGDNTLVWSGALVGHHSKIGSNCWITSNANIGGNSLIGNNCFIGIDATIVNSIEIGQMSIIGARSLINKSVSDKSVFIEKSTSRFRLDSSEFIKLFGDI